MGTDIEIQGMKTIIVDEDRRFVLESFREYDVISRRPSWAEQWPDVWSEDNGGTGEDKGLD